jgi:hypothetical protein
MSVEGLSVSMSGFSVSAVQAEQQISLRMTGSAETPAMGSLQGLFNGVHAEMLRQGLPKVVVDLRELEFMNSSCFKTFVSWLAEVQETDSAKRYHVHFLSDTKKHWQKKSLNALSAFAIDLVKVET